jgi:hypothetical protein
MIVAFLIILNYIKYQCNNCKLYKEMEPTRNIRLRKLQWVGQVVEMKEERVLR